MAFPVHEELIEYGIIRIDIIHCFQSVHQFHFIIDASFPENVRDMLTDRFVRYVQFIAYRLIWLSFHEQTNNLDLPCSQMVLPAIVIEERPFVRLRRPKGYWTVR